MASLCTKHRFKVQLLLVLVGLLNDDCASLIAQFQIRELRHKQESLISHTCSNVIVTLWLSRVLPNHQQFHWLDFFMHGVLIRAHKCRIKRGAYAGKSKTERNRKHKRESDESEKRGSDTERGFTAEHQNIICTAANLPSPPPSYFPSALCWHITVFVSTAVFIQLIQTSQRNISAAKRKDLMTDPH